MKKLYQRLFLSLSVFCGISFFSTNDAVAYTYKLTMTDAIGTTVRTMEGDARKVYQDLYDDVQRTGKGTRSGTGLNGGSPEITVNCAAGYYAKIGTKLDCVLSSCAAGFQPKIEGGCTGCTGGYASTTNSYCKMCKPGYYARGFKNNKCTACPDNATCSGYGNNDFSCNSGYKQNDAKTACVSACSSNQYLDGSTCKNCPTGCSACSSGTVCTSCNSKYFLSGNSCVSCPSNYQTCSGSTLTCKSKYYRSGNSCVNCPANSTNCSGSSFSCKSGYYKSGSSCMACSNGCQTCSSGSLCTVCIGGYTLSNGSCSSCGYKCSLCEGASCPYTNPKLGPIPCQNFVPTSSNCLACESGYELVNGKCMKTYTVEINDAGWPSSTSETYDDTTTTLASIASGMSKGKLTCSASGDTVTCQCPSGRYYDMSRCSSTQSYAAEHGGATGVCKEVEAGECGVKILKEYTFEKSDGQWPSVSETRYYDDETTSLETIVSETATESGMSCSTSNNTVTCSCAEGTYLSVDRCKDSVSEKNLAGVCVASKNECGAKIMTGTVDKCNKTLGTYSSADGTYCYKAD